MFIKHHNREWKPDLGVYPLGWKKQDSKNIPLDAKQLPFPLTHPHHLPSISAPFPVSVIPLVLPPLPLPPPQKQSQA